VAPLRFASSGGGGWFEAAAVGGDCWDRGS